MKCNPIVVFLLAAVLGGCATSPGIPPRAVAIPDDCIRLARPVPYPPIVKREDLGLRTAKYAAALGQANATITDVRQCDEAVMASFSGRK